MGTHKTVVMTCNGYEGPCGKEFDTTPRNKRGLCPTCNYKMLLARQRKYYHDKHHSPIVAPVDTRTPEEQAYRPLSLYSAEFQSCGRSQCGFASVGDRSNSTGSQSMLVEESGITPPHKPKKCSGKPPCVNCPRRNKCEWGIYIVIEKWSDGEPPEQLRQYPKVRQT